MNRKTFGQIALAQAVVKAERDALDEWCRVGIQEAEDAGDGKGEGVDQLIMMRDFIRQRSEMK